MQGIDAATEGPYLDRGLDSLAKAAGIRPTGYRAPWWELNWHSAALLADRGFLYDSSPLDGDAPYRFSVAEGDPRDLVEIPVEWALDDWEVYAFYPGVTGSGVIESPAKVPVMWTLEAEAHHAAGSCFEHTRRSVPEIHRHARIAVPGFPDTGASFTPATVRKQDRTAPGRAGAEI